MHRMHTLQHKVPNMIQRSSINQINPPHNVSIGKLASAFNFAQNFVHLLYIWCDWWLLGWWHVMRIRPMCSFAVFGGCPLVGRKDVLPCTFALVLSLFIDEQSDCNDSFTSDCLCLIGMSIGLFWNHIGVATQFLKHSISRNFQNLGKFHVYYLFKWFSLSVSHQEISIAPIGNFVMLWYIFVTLSNCLPKCLPCLPLYINPTLMIGSDCHHLSTFGCSSCSCNLLLLTNPKYVILCGF